MSDFPDIQTTPATPQAGFLINRNFALLFLGRLLSQLGDAVYLFSLSWYILVTTGSTAKTGIVMMTSLIATVIIGPIAGVWIDRINRKTVLISMDAIRMLIVGTMGVLLYFDILPFWLLCTGTGLVGICTSVFNPACSSILPNLVSKDNLTKANSLDSIAVNASQVVGALIGAVLYAWLGIVAIFILNAASYMISALLQSGIRYSPTAHKVPGEFMNELKAGFSYLKTKRALYLVFIYLIGLNFLLAPILEVYLPYIVQHLLHGTVAQLSYIRVSFAFGIVIGGAIMSKLPQVELLNRRFIFSLLLFSISLFGMLIPVLPNLLDSWSLHQAIWFYISLTVVTGLFFGFASIISNVIFQKDVEDEYRGRITSLLMTFGSSAMPFGYLIGGVSAASIPMYVLIATTAGFLLLITLMMLISKPIKEL
ncbi:putative bacilysin exporter BacE [compost metagenome]